MQAFASWLEDKEEFTYVVDGANVAYNRQNFGDGKFSFRQVRRHSSADIALLVVR